MSFFHVFFVRGRVGTSEVVVLPASSGFAVRKRGALLALDGKVLGLLERILNRGIFRLLNCMRLLYT